MPSPELSANGDLYLYSAMAARVRATAGAAGEARAGMRLEEEDVRLLRDNTITGVEASTMALGASRPFVYLGDLIDFGVARFREVTDAAPGLVLFCGDGPTARPGESSTGRIMQRMPEASLSFAVGQHRGASVVDALWLLRLMLGATPEPQIAALICADLPSLSEGEVAKNTLGYAALLAGTDPKAAAWRLAELDTGTVFERDAAELCDAIVARITALGDPAAETVIRCGGAPADLADAVASRMSHDRRCRDVGNGARRTAAPEFVWSGIDAIETAERNDAAQIVLWTYLNTGVLGLARLSRCSAGGSA